MNTILWALQIILAIKLLTVTFNHGVRPDPVKMQRGQEWLGAAQRPLLVVIALLALLAALALVLPVARSVLPLTASLTALLMLIATGFHLTYQDDHEQLEREMPVYDALYAYCRERMAAGS